MGLQEQQAQRDLLARRGYRATKVLLDYQVLPELQVAQALLVSQAQVVRLAFKEAQVRPVQA